MKVGTYLAALSLLALLKLAAVAVPPAEAPIVPADPVAAGRELAARLLALRPAADATNTASLHVRASRTNTFEVPLLIVIHATDTNWSTTYSTQGTNTIHAATFTVIRTGSGSNAYQVRRFSHPSGDTNGIENLTGEQALVPFADSDFWLGDLGMEFLHWPTQRLLRKELCRGQSCDRLESVAPAGQTNGYTRVVGWFDIDTGGPVLIEAYDASGRMVKEFKPNKFKKVNGQWQVEELEITNRRTGSRSWIRFKITDE
jgi:hypothetical protein